MWLLQPTAGNIFPDKKMVSMTNLAAINSQNRE